MPPTAKAALNKALTPAKALLAAVLALCEAVTADPDRYPELLPLAHAVLERLPQPKGEASGQKEAA